MARTETEGGSNWVHTGDDMTKWDITRIKPCTSVVQDKNLSGDITTKNDNGKCTYKNKADLRYIYIF